MQRADIEQQFDLTDRVAIVTGASRGIGFSLAQAMAAQGARVVITSRKPDDCDEAVARITDAGGDALAAPTHMGDLEALDALVATTVSHFGAIDIVVNNAANALALPAPDITPEAWAKSFDVNLRGPFFLFQKCLPHLLASDHAAVLNIISSGAYMNTPGQIMYGGAKAALLHMTRALAAAYSPQGIRVNALAPGTTDTKMVRNLGDEAAEAMASVSYLNRLAHPDEMVGAALLLVSDAGSYITGQSIIVDGGCIPAR
ncbi:MAG: SDR family NAD(P)-dependent oxidoreductase [Acidimicrobiales bacterium]